MPKTHKTAVVIIPPENAWPPIQAIRHEHDRKVNRWMPHITLIYPFCPLADFPEMVEEISESCRDQPPFEVSLTSFDSFSHGKGHFTVWLKPEPNESLLDLHAAAWTAVSFDEDFAPRIGKFTPHLSVGQVRGRTQRDELVEKLQKDWKPLSFPVSAVQLIARKDPPNDTFEIAETVALGRNV
jgi:2'-5' RNA ligase